MDGIEPHGMTAAPAGSRRVTGTVQTETGTTGATSGRLRIVLEPYAPEVPGLYLYFPKRSQVSPALRAFVEVAREKVKG